MKKIDIRTLNPEIQYELRKQYIHLRKKGMSNQLAAETVGISATRASTIWQLFHKNGIHAIKPKLRGRKLGEHRTLTAEQDTAVIKLLVDKTPDQLGLQYALWSKEAVRLAIKTEIGIELPLRTLTDYLKRWGFTPLKPTRRACENSAPAVRQWFTTTYPGITARAKQEKAEIHWGDETGIRNDVCNFKEFAPTPIVRLHAKLGGINMVLAISNQGKVRFMLYQEAMTARVFTEFLDRLVRDAKRKVFLILDDNRLYHSKIVKDWLEEHNGLIELFSTSIISLD